MRHIAIFLLGLTCAVVGVCTETSAKPTFDIVQDRENALYGCGETATFTVRVADSQGGAPTNGLVAWTLDNFGSVKVGSGSADLAKANPFTVRGKLDEPGFLRLTARCDDASKVWSVGYDVGRIRQDEPCPADFDEYWQGEKARLAREVPLDARCEKVDRMCSAARDAYRISFATFNGTRLWGFMTIPTDRSKAPFRTVLRVCDAGTGATGPWSDRTDEITVTMNVFPFEPAANEKEQRKLLDAFNRSQAAKYGLAPGSYCALCGVGDSREDYFFHDAMLGLARAVDWIAARPEVDPKRLVYFGSSQGGGFGLYLNYLVPRFVRAVFAVPAATGHFGFRQRRQDGWPNLVLHQPAAKRAAAERNAAYFDGVNFAARIRVPVRFIVGFADGCCPPPNVYAAYNVCPSADKAIVNAVGAEHCGSIGWIWWIDNHRGAPSWLDHNAWLRN